MLLTTGLGLVGMSAEALSGYARALARQGVAALVLELGRTFTRVPAELREVAAAHHLPLILLHGVVPFIDITETVHPLLIAAEIEQLRRIDRASADLNRTLLAGRGLTELLATVRDVCRAPTGLYSLDEHLLAGDGVFDGRAGEDAGRPLEVEVGSGPWALLVVDTDDSDDVRRLAEMCATSIGIYLSQTSQANPTRRMAGADLLRDIAGGRYLSSAELTSRASAVGFAVRRGCQVLGIVVEVLTSVRSGLSATTVAARSVSAPRWWPSWTARCWWPRRCAPVSCARSSPSSGTRSTPSCAPRWAAAWSGSPPARWSTTWPGWPARCPAPARPPSSPGS